MRDNSLTVPTRPIEVYGDELAYVLEQVIKDRANHRNDAYGGPTPLGNVLNFSIT